MTDQDEPTEPPGPTVKWETVHRQFDADGRLVSERTTTVVDTVIDQPEPPDRHTGQYL